MNGGKNPESRVHERKHDGFLSYTWANNGIPSVSTEKRGWIDLFYADLEHYLKNYSGKEFYIWRDSRDLENTELLTDEIKRTLKESKILIIVLSPPYVYSKWCRDEIDVFYKSFNNIIEAHEYIYPIEFLPLNAEETRRLPGNFLGIYPSKKYVYKFHEKNAEKISKTFDPRIGPEYFMAYQDRLLKLVKDLHIKLKQIKGESKEPHKTIYLAEVADSINQQNRDKISSFLTEIGLIVLPDPKQVNDRLEPANQPRDDLRQCLLSVHIVGESDDSTQSGIAVLNSQLYNFIREREQEEEEFISIFWKPRRFQLDAQTQDEISSCTQRSPSNFLDGASETEVQYYILDKIDKLKQKTSRSHEAISSYSEPTISSTLSQDDNLSDNISSETNMDKIKIYLIHNPNDATSDNTYLEIKRCLRRKRPNISIWEPNFSNRPEKNCNQHNQNLNECDMRVIYDSGKNANWLLAHKSYLNRLNLDYTIIYSFEDLDLLLK
jgi:hypothetical protein